MQRATDSKVPAWFYKKLSEKRFLIIKATILHHDNNPYRTLKRTRKLCLWAGLDDILVRE